MSQPEDTLLDTMVGRRHPARLGGRYVAVAVACVVVVGYLAGVTPKWWPTPDGAMYLGLGRSLAAGEGYRFNGEFNNVFPPGLPLVLAALRRVFGGGFLAPNLFVTLCGLASLVMIYKVMRILSGDRRMALGVTFATAMSYPFYFNSHLILSDIPFVLVFWSLLYTLIRHMRGGRQWLILSVLLAAGGICLRLGGLLLIGPLAVGIVLDRSLHTAPRTKERTETKARRGGCFTRRQLSAAGLVLAAAVITAVLFVMAGRNATDATPRYADFVGPSKLTDPQVILHRFGGAVIALPAALAAIFTSQVCMWPLGIVIGVLVSAALRRFWKSGERLIPVMVVLYPLGLAVCLGSFGMISRYFLPIQPLLIYAVITGVFPAVRRVAVFYRNRGVKIGVGGKVLNRIAPGEPGANVPGLIIAVLTLAMVACNVPRLARHAFYYSYFAHWGGYYDKIYSGKYADMFRTGELLQRNCPRDTRVAASRRTVNIIHFISGRLTQPLPDVPAHTSRHADEVLRFIAVNRQMAFVSLDSMWGERDFRQRLIGVMDADEGFKVIDRGRWILYQRVK